MTSPIWLELTRGSLSMPLSGIGKRTQTVPGPEDSLYLKHMGMSDDQQLLQTLKVQGQKAKTPVVKDFPFRRGYRTSLHISQP